MSTEVKKENETRPESPQKSSMEILSELFSTFHAKPPLIIKKEKSEESSKKHKKKKKHKSKDKKHKKKEKRKKRSNSNSPSSEKSEKKVDLEQILIKQEKELAEKKIKIEIEEMIKKEKADVKETELEKNRSNPDKLEHGKNGKQKIIIKDIKFKSLFDSAIKDIKQNIDEVEEGEASDSDTSRKKKKHKSHSKKRSRSKSRDTKEKKLKTDDKYDKREREKERDKEKLKEKDKHRRHSSRDRDKDYHHYRDRSRSREKGWDNFYSGKTDKTSRDHDKDRHDRYRDRYRDEYSREIDEYKRSRSKQYKEDTKRNDLDDKWFMRDRYRGPSDRDRRRSSSNDRDSKFDRKKLLEIARRNAITMMKSGSLPAALTLGPQAQEKVIAAIKSGGKTIEELTDFCKTLSKKEELGELSSLSEKEDSDSDADKPFHHPFQIKDRPTSITMNIKNSVPLPVKSALERTGELRLQFPVSSGQHHRKGEEWLPVSPPSEKKSDTLPAGATLGAPTTTKSIPLPIEPAPPPFPSALPPLPVLPPPPLPKLPPLPSRDHPLPILPAPVPALATIPAPPNAPPGPQVFPKAAPHSNVDIGSIVSQRLSAMRKLQENPNDVQALTQIYKSNKEMQSWATSKQQLGQFTGSTGAHILSQAELSSGYQAWAKKDQLQTAAPVSGGMGMHLLQKMGWRPGEGLGKEKTGALEPLLLEVKLDKKGLVANEEQKHPKKRQKIPGSVKNFLGKHPVSLLGEYATKNKLGAPQYVLEFECGPDHKKNFLFKVLLNGVEYKPNVASNNKKEAKLAAASICLQQIGLLPKP